MKKLYVGNLSYQSTEGDLQSAFGQFGAIESIEMIMDRYTGRSKGFGFVTFEDEAAAQEAQKALDGTDLGGRSIRVSEARKREGGGGGGGREGGGRGGNGGRGGQRGGSSDRW